VPDRTLSLSISVMCICLLYYILNLRN